MYFKIVTEVISGWWDYRSFIYFKKCFTFSTVFFFILELYKIIF